MGAMRLIGNHADRKFAGPDVQVIGGNFSGSRVDLGDEREQLLGQPRRLSSGLFLDFGTPSQLLKETAVSLAEFDGPIAQNLRRPLPEKGCAFGDELAVLLIDGNWIPRRADHASGKAAKVAILLHLSMIDQAMNETAMLSASHAVYSLRLHIVFVTKYRRTTLTPEILNALRETLTDWRCTLIEFGGEADHVHLVISLHPALNISILIDTLKSASSRRMRNRFRFRITSQNFTGHRTFGTAPITSGVAADHL